MKLLLKLRFSSISQELPSLILAVLFRFRWFSCSQSLSAFLYISFDVEPDESLYSYTSCALTGTSQFLLIPFANVLTYVLANHVPAFTVSAYKMQFITMRFSMKFLNLI